MSNNWLSSFLILKIGELSTVIIVGDCAVIDPILIIGKPLDSQLKELFKLRLLWGDFFFDKIYEVE